MAGKRVAQPEAGTATRRSHKAIWITLLVLILLLAAAAAGLCFYAARFDGVFPGVSMAGTDLSGQSLSQAEETLSGVLPGWVDQRSVSVTADGEDLGTYPLSQLGAYAVAGEAARAAWDTGREPGLLGWLRNGWTMAKGLLGQTTELTAAVYYDEAALARTVEDMASRFDRPAADASYELTREGLFATRETYGRALDREKLSAALMTAVDTVEAPWVEVPGKALDLEALARELSAEASPARYDVQLGKVVDGQVGVSMEPSDCQSVLDAAAPGETVQLPAQIIFPEMTAQEMEAVLFRDLLGTTTTKVSGSSVRRGNVRLSGETVNGTVLNAGEVFDYNKVVGQRTEERGYGAAATYVNGETVDTVGGGICQTSSTIYLAALLSNLEIVERYNHRFWPGYIDLGMDATVSWGGPEFRFKNNTDYPIRIDVSYEGSKLTVSIYGTKTDDTYVKMSRKVLSSTAYETEYVETEELPYGTEKQKQNGYTGYVVESYRNVYSGDGKLISSTLEAKSVYSNRNRIILVGTAGRPDAGITPPPEGGGDSGEPAPPPPDSGGEPVLPPESGGGTETGGADTTPPGWL